MAQHPRRWVVLLRGINVNPSTRISMAGLRDLLADLGHDNAKTLLQSGNIILDSDTPPDAAAIADAVRSRHNITSPVVALPIEEFRAIVEANPLLDSATDLSKLVITFAGSPISPADIDRPADADLAPERLVITERAIYQWCPDGILQSKLKPAWWKQFGQVLTGRNARTANRILELDT